MAKPLKLILVLFAGLLLLLAVAIVALPFLFDPNDFRGKLAETVKKETGREFSVGEIRLSVFPWLRVEIADAVLGNAAGFGSEPMLRLKSAEVGVKLLPLLREGRVEASEVKLDGLRAALAVNAEGISNWADLLALQKQKKDEPAADAGSGKGLADLDIAGVQLEDVALSYADAQAGKDYAVEGLRLKLGRLRAGETLPFEGALTLNSGAPKARAALDFDGELRFDADTGSAQVADLKLKLDGQKDGVTPAENLAAKLQLEAPTLSYDGQSQVLTVAPFQLVIEQLLAGTAEQAKLSAKGALGASLKADLAQRRHELKGLELALEVVGSAIPGGKPQGLKLNGAASADLAEDSARVDGLQLEFAGLKASAKQLLVAGLTGELPTASGDLTLAPFSPRGLLTNMGIKLPEMADAQTLQSASLSAGLSANANSVAFKNLLLKLDDSTLSGELAVRDFASQALAFALKLDAIDADRYLPPKAAEAPAAGSEAAKSNLNDTPLPVEMLDKLNAEGTLAIGKLKLKGVTLGELRLQLDAPKSGNKRQQLSAKLYGGSANLAMDVSPGAKPGYALKTTLSGISAGPLLKDFLGKDYVSGKGSVNLDVRSGGRTVGEVRRALNGDVAFNFVDGAVKGFNLGKTIRDGQALLSVAQGGAATAAAASEPQSTDFAELRGAGKIVNGVLKSDQLSAKNPLFRLEGAGELDLANETINYLAKPTLVGTAKGQGGKELADLHGVVVPIRLSGNLFKPKVQIDWQAALQQQAADKLRGQYEAKKEELQEHREEIKQKAVDELNKGLMKLFGGNKKPPAEPAPGSTPQP
jgi:AsmA protein